MELKQRIITYILKNAPVTYDTILEKATSKGYTKLEVLETLELVHKDKRIKQTTKGDTIVYQLATAKEPPSMSHLKWVRDNYPPMTPENDGSGIDADFSYLFLRSKEERDAFMAEMSGRPRYVKTRK